MEPSESDSASLKIPKHAVGVETCDSRGNKRRLEIYLAQPATPEERGERLQDLLRERQFVPARAGGSLEFLSTRHLMWVRLELIAALDELDPQAEYADGSVSALVKVSLEDGSDLVGGMRYLMPAGWRRIGDYLESLPGLFPLRTPEWLYLVNKDRVIRVVPIDEVSPIAAASHVDEASRV